MDAMPHPSRDPPDYRCEDGSGYRFLVSGQCSIHEEEEMLRLSVCLLTCSFDK